MLATLLYIHEFCGCRQAQKPGDPFPWLGIHFLCQLYPSSSWHENNLYPHGSLLPQWRVRWSLAAPRRLDQLLLRRQQTATCIHHRYDDFSRIVSTLNDVAAMNTPLTLPQRRRSARAADCLSRPRRPRLPPLPWLRVRSWHDCRHGRVDRRHHPDHGALLACERKKGILLRGLLRPRCQPRCRGECSPSQQKGARLLGLRYMAVTQGRALSF